MQCSNTVKVFTEKIQCGDRRGFHTENTVRVMLKVFTHRKYSEGAAKGLHTGKAETELYTRVAQHTRKQKRLDTPQPDRS